MGGGDEVLGDAVAGFGYGAGYGGEGVGIAAERDGVADGVLVAFGVERADDRPPHDFSSVVSIGGAILV